MIDLSFARCPRGYIESRRTATKRMNTYPAWHEHYEPGVPRTIDIPEMPRIRGIAQKCAALSKPKAALRLILRYLPLGLRWAAH